MLNRFLKHSLAAAVLLGLAHGASAEGLTLEKPAKIAMVYISPRNDGGWTQAFDESRVKLEKELGTKIQYVESVPENAAAISAAIDKEFSNSLAETLTETEKAFQLGFVSMSEAIVVAIRVVSFVVIVIIAAVMANTMAMSARERLGDAAYR
mgnify:CR=1 FL=1